MVTRNELAAIIAALNTDFDTPPADSQDSEPRRDAEARNDAHLDHSRTPEHIDKAS